MWILTNACYLDHTSNACYSGLEINDELCATPPINQADQSASKPLPVCFPPAVVALHLLDAALQRHALVVGDADPPTVDVAYHCALDLLVRGRAVEPPLAVPQEPIATATAPKHLEPSRTPSTALGDATNVAH